MVCFGTMCFGTPCSKKKRNLLVVGDIRIVLLDIDLPSASAAHQQRWLLNGVLGGGTPSV